MTPMPGIDNGTSLHSLRLAFVPSACPSQKFISVDFIDISNEVCLVGAIIIKQLEIMQANVK